jgi:hypothetical protein
MFGIRKKIKRNSWTEGIPFFLFYLNSVSNSSSKNLCFKNREV